MTLPEILTPTETWLPVLDFEGLYEVSDAGRVRSLPRATTSGRVLKARRERRGYLVVGLSKDAVASTRLVHALVLESFVGPRPEGQEVRHENGDKGDNRLKNLSWGTRSDQRLDDVRNGVHKESRKTRCPRGHEYDIKRKRGGRDCRTCRNDHARRRYADSRR